MKPESLRLFAKLMEKAAVTNNRFMAVGCCSGIYMF